MSNGKPEKVCAVDLGIKRLITAFDGQNVISYHGGEVSAKLRYRNKELAELQSKQSKCQKGSKRWQKLQRAKRRMLKCVTDQIRDILHKITGHFVGWCLSNGVGTVVIGDIRNIRERVEYNDTANQKIHQWMYGKLLKMLEGKAKLCGAQNILKDRRYECQCGLSIAEME